MKARKAYTLLTILILSTFSLFAQPYLIPVDAPNNKYPITFTDINQQILILEFDRAIVSAGTSAGWTITVGGSPVAMVGNPTSAGNFLRITLSSSISYANRNAVLVSYNAVTGNLSLTGPVEPNFTNIQAVNNYIAVAADFTNGLYGENAPKDICAAVTDVEVEFNLILSKRYRNSIHYSGPRVWIQWQYPAALPRTVGGFFTEIGVGSGIYRTIDNWAGYPDNTLNCTWDVSIFPYLYSTGTLQPNLLVTQNTVIITLPNYKKDNGTPVPGTGDLGLDPPVDDPRTLFCVGEDITAFRFTDATVFDCQLAVEPDLPNIEPRFVQFVYGTHTAPGIPNVFINVFGTMVQVTDNNGVAISGTWHVNPDGTPNGPGYTTPSGFFEGPVVKYVWDAGTKTLVTPLAQTYPIYHTGDYINDQENDIFDVTLRNWGPCNLYDAMDPFSYSRAVTDFSRLRLVGAPPLPTASDKEICQGGVATLSAIRNGANPGMLHWYNNSNLLPANEVGTGPTFDPDPSRTLAAGTYNYWVREIGTTGLFCEGPAKKVTLTIRQPLSIIGTISAVSPVCLGATGQVFSLLNNPPTMVPGGTTMYDWTIPAEWTNLSGDGTKQISADVTGTSGSKTVSVILQYTSVPNCPSSPVSRIITVDPVSVGGTVNGGTTICSGSTSGTLTLSGHTGSVVKWQSSVSPFSTWTDISNTATTYTSGSLTQTTRFRAVVQSGVCAQATSSYTTVTVDPASVGGSVSGGTTICSGSTSGTLTLSGHTGNVVRWQRSVSPFSSWTDISNTSTTYTSGALTQTTQFRAVVKNGVCSEEYSTATTVTVDPASVGGSVSGGTTICTGSTSGTLTLSGHTGSVVKWQSSVSPFSTWTDISNTLTTYTSGTLTQTTRFRAVVQSGVCATANSSYTTVTVSPLTVGGSVSGGTTICSGSTSGTLTLAGHTGSVVKWQSSVSPFSTWNDITNTTTTYTSGALTQTTRFRAVVQSGPCASANSNYTTVTVEPALNAGTIGYNQSKCAPADPDIFTQISAVSGGLAPYSYQWKSSTTTGGPYSSISGANGLTYDPPAGLGVTTYYVRTVTSSGVCGSVNSNEIKVTVNPARTSEVKSLSGPSGTCKNSTITMTYQNVANADQYVWDYSWTGAGIDATTLVPTINIDLTGIAVGSYTIKVAGINGCNVPADYPWSLEHTININDIPDLSSLTATACSDVANGITLSITNSGAYCSGITYNITDIIKGTLNASAGTPVTGTGFGANEISNDAWTNKTAASANVVYKVVPVSSQNCTGNSEDVIVTVNPEPDLKNLNKAVCSDEATGITLTDEHGLANRFNIVSINPQAGLTPAAGNATSGADQLAAAIANDKFTNKTSGSLSVTYAIIPRINGGCIGDQENVVVTINPEPDLKNLDKPVCSDDATGITLSDEHGLANRFQIVSISVQAGLTPAAGNATTGTGKLASAIANDKFTNKTAGSLTVTYAIIPRIDAGCIGDQENVVVTINPEPDLSNLNKTICSDEATGITLADVHGLANRFQIVSITPQAGLQTTAGNSTTGTGKLADVIFNDKWTNKTAAALTVTYTIIPRIDAGCIGDQENVVVTINPEPDLSSLNKTVCSDEATGITLTDVNGLANRFELVSITPAAGLNPAAGNATTGTGKLANAIANDRFTNKTTGALTVIYAIIPRIDGGCIGDQENVIVTINPEPDLKDLNKTVCSTVAIGITLSDVHNLADRFQIVSITPDAGLTGDPGNSTIGPLQAANAIANDKWTNLTGVALKVVYAVIPRINGGCVGDQENIEVIISPEPDLSPLNKTVCSGVAIAVTLSDILGLADQFDILSISAQTGLTPGGSNVVAGNGKPSNYISNDIWINTTTGNLTVTYKVVPSIGALCYGKPEDVIITIRPPVIPGSITGNTSICYNSDAPVISNAIPASGGDGNISYTWYYTENLAAVPGSADWNLIVGATGSGYDPGILTNPTKFVRKAKDGSCPDEAYSEMITISINPLPVTSAITGPSVLCEDATNKVYQVVNHPGSTYAWTVPPSLTITSPPGLYFIIVDAVPGMAAPGDKITVVETIVGTGCVGTPVELPVSVVSVVPGVVVNGPTSICLGDTATYSVPDNSGSTYSWSIPAGAYIISDPGLHSVEVTFKMAVTGDVFVIENSNGVCNTIHTKVTVTVNPLPAIFNVTAPVAYCAGPTGVTITLSGSQSGVNYQLYNSIGPVDTPVPGTGLALIWTNKTTEAYHVLATNATTGCKQLMNGTVAPVVNVVDGGEIGSEQAVCENSTPAAFTNTTSASGGGALTYQWQRSPDNSTWTDIPGATSAVYASGPLSANTYFRRMAISTLGSSVCIDPSNSVLVTVIIFNPGSISSDISICEGTAPANPFTSVPPSGTGTFTFRWLSSTDGVNYSPAGPTAETFTPGVLNVDTWFKREVTATYLTRACIEETNAVKVTVINFSPGSIGSDQTICSNTAPAPFTSVAATGDGSFTYSWESSLNGTSGWSSLGVLTPTYSSPALTTDRYFRRAVTSTHGGTSCTLYTNTVHVSVNDFDPGTIGTAKTICEGDNSGLINSVLPASGDPLATFTYQWLSSTDGTNFSSISGATNVSYTSGPLLVDTYFRRQVTATLNGRACIELTPSILIKVNNFTPGSIDGTQTVCEGEIPSAFTEAAAAVTDGAITYQWQESANGINGWTNVTSGGSAATYAPPAALAGDMWFKRLVTSTLDGVLCTKESNIIKVTVNNFQPGSIADNQSICENSPAAPITSISPTGDGTFTYRWRRSADGVNFSLIGSATGETYNPGILTADTWYRRIVRSTVNGKTCVDSTNVVKITVINFDPGSITGEQIVCEGDVPALLGSNPPSGDGPFTYQWKQSTNGITWTDVPSGGSGPAYAPPALTQDTWYKRVVNSSDGVASCSLETDPVKVTVINFNPGSIASDQTICEGTAPAAFTSVAASGDGVKTYQWQISTNGTDFSDINLATNATYSSPALSQDTWFRRISTATIDTKSCYLPTNTVFVKVIRFDPGEIGSNQTICEGEIPALLTETVAATGNGTFTYLWQSSLDNSDWNNITGATSTTYAPGALTQDTYFRRQVTATLNGRTCIEFTPSVIVRVNNITPGSISGNQTICENDTPVPFIETAAAASDFGHAYQWQESTDGTNWTNVPSGGNNPTYIPPALSQDTWYKRLITSTVGLNTCEEESNVIKVTVNNFNPGSIEEDQTICENTPAALLTSITPTGDGIFSYRWFISTDGTNFSPIDGATNETYNPGILAQDTWYYREVKSTLNGKECIENTNTVVITVNNLTPGSISGDQDICEGGDPVAFTSNLPTFDGTVSYMWQSSTDGLNYTDIGATDEIYDPPALNVDTWFRRAVTSTILLNACTEYTNPVKVTVINFAPGSIGSSQTICEGATPAPFTSVAASGDGTKSYQWEISTDSIDWDIIPLATSPTYASPALTQDTWFRRLSSATIGSVKCTEITDTIKVTVINFDPGSISGPQTICENDTPAPFTSADAGGDGVITYQWQASLDGTNFTNITGATLNVYGHGSLTTDTWFRRQATATLNGTQCIDHTTPVLITVNNMTPGSISGTQTICEGTTPVPFTSAPATGDGIITYQWMQSADNGANWINVPSGGDVEVYVAPKLNADMWYKRVATSTSGGVTCAEESNIIMVTVNNFNPGNIAAEQTICENTAPAPFTSTTPTGDGVFTYRWFRSTDGSNFGTPIPTAISETYSPGILAQDTWYFREVTSTIGTNKCIARTDTIKITVNNFVPGNITGTQTICEDSAPTEFTETAPAVSNDGSIITYQWQDSPDGIFFTDINLATAPTYTSPALSADTWFRRAVKSVLGSNECTEYTDIIKVTVINFASGSIGSDQTICEGTAPAPFTSVAASGDGTKSYQWQISTNGVAFTDINLATNATYTSPVLTQDTWFRRLSTATVGTYQCTEITDTIKITVINFDPGTISTDQTICEGDIPAEVTSPAATGDGTFAYQWQSSTDGSAFSGISGATSENYAPGALTVDTWYKRQVTATVNGMSCMKFTPAVKITVNNVLPGSIGGAQTICVNGTPLALTSVTAASGDGTITYQWKESADNGTTWADVPSGGNGPAYVPPALAADMLYKRIAFSDLPGKICQAESNTMKITVVNFDPGSIGDAQTICEGTAPNALTSVSPSGDGSFTFRWFRSADNSTFILIPGAESETYSPGILTQDTWYYREVTASIGATSCPANTNKVLITVNNFDPGSLDADQTICEGDDPVLINGVEPSGDGLSYTYKWYESLDGTVFTEIASATSATFDPPALTVDTWYKRARTSHLNGNACTEETAPVRIWVINFNPGTIGTDQTICENTAPAPFTGTAPSGDGSFTYSWEFSINSGTDWNPVPGGITTATYSAPALTADTWYRRVVTSEVNGFTCSETTPVVIVTVNNFNPGSISAAQWICEGDTPAPFGSGSPSGDGTFTYQWQSSLNGSTFSNITGATEETYSAGPLVADTWYRRLVTSTLNGNPCTEPTAVVKVTVNNLTAGAIGSDQIICEGTPPAALTSVSPTFDGTVTYQWQFSTDGTNFAPVGGAISETYNPPALSADTWYKRIVTSTLNVSCSKESNIVRITVNNFDPGSIIDNQTICEGSAPAPILSVTPTGDGVFSYKWFRSNDGTNFAEIFGAVSETYNPGNLIADTWYRREVTSKVGSNTCTLPDNIVKITVNNLDPGLVTGEQVICEGVVPAPITGTAATGDGSTISYQWRISNDGVNYTDITTNGQNQSYIPGALTQDTWFLRMATSDLGGQKCTEMSGSFRVIVNNVNPGTIISDQTICNGSDPVAFISIVHGTGDGTITYEWQSSTNGTDFNPISSTNAPNYDSPALTQDTWFRRITRSDISGNICEKISNVVKVTVNEVHGGTIGSDQSICFGKIPAPLTSTDDGSGTGTVTYQWLRSGDGVIWNTVSGAVSEDYTPTNIHYADTWYKRVLISIRNGVLCQAESNPVKITVNSLPVAVLTGGETICPGDPATLTIEITDGTAPYILEIENHGVVTITSSTAVIPVNPLTGVVTYKLLKVTDVYGCEAVNMIGTATFTVRELPEIVKGPVDKITCEYGVVKYDVVATGTDLVYQWYVDKKDGLGFIKLSDAGIYYGVQTPTLNLYGVTRDMNGYMFHVTVTTCGSTKQSADVKLTVNTVPEIQQHPKDTTICSTKNAAFSILATGTNLTYRWQYKKTSGGFIDVVDDGVNFTGAADSILYLTNVPGSFNNYLFRVIVDGDCGSALYSNIVALRVNVPPVPVLHPVSKPVCDGGGPVFFVANGAGIIDSIRWQVSKDAGVSWEDLHDNAIYSGTTSQQLSIIDVPFAYNNYWYRLALKAFCETTYTNHAVLTVNKLPVVTFAQDPIPACGGVSLVITPTVSEGSGTWISHNWSGDIGPLNNYFSQTPTFKTLIADTYNLTYRVVDNNMCAGEGTVSVVVDAPDATFTQDIPMECTPAKVKFSKDMTGLKSWEWNFGDGTPVNTTDATVEHIFINTTSTAIVYRTIKLTVESMAGCKDSTTSMMTIYPSINANLTASDDSVCHGSQLTFTADPGANIYKWDYGDLTPVVPGINTSTHMFLNPAGAPVTRTVEVVTTSLYGCSDSTTIDIVVMPMPQAQFSATPNNPTFDAAGNDVTFKDETTPLSTWTYQWDFGDAASSTEQNPVHKFTGIGTYNVVLTVSNGKCSSQISHPVTILPIPPVANFDSIPSGCATWTIKPKNTSLNTEAPGTTYRWDFGDGSYSTAKDPEYTYYKPGEYRVELTVTGPGGVRMKSQMVRAYPSPKAYFEVSPTLVFVNDERVRCFNLSEGGDYWVWDFGDGDTSRIREPYHKYMEEGVYDITLWAYSNNGCSDMFILSPGVTVQPAGDVRFSTVFTPNKTGPIERTDLPTGGTEMDQFFFPPIRDKVIRYKLQIFNRLGVLIFESHNINIPWNGYYKGKLCPQGVYVWYVEGKYANGEPFKKVGDITLLH